MKRLLGVIVVLGLVGAFGWYLRRRIIEANEPPRRRGGGRAVVAVEVAPVTTGTIRDIDRFTGTLKPRSQYVVAPKIGGRLETLRVNIGDRVDSGDLIATLDDDEHRLGVEQARAELKIAQANLLETKSALDVARREFDRIQILHDRRIASESELDTARAQFEAKGANDSVARAQVAYKEASLRSAEVRLSYATISVAWHDPLDTNPASRLPNGPPQRVIGERHVDPGAMLRANDPIVSVLDLNTVVAVVHIIERDYAEVHVGQGAAITTDAYPGRQFSGRVARVAPLLRETSRQARVEIEVPNPDWLLRPGMFIRAELEFAVREKATLVPTTALTRRDGKDVVFLADLEQKKATLVETRVGIVEGDRAEILAPPIRGHVVTLGQHLLSDGAAIVVPEATTQPTSASTRPGGARGERRGPEGGRP